MRWRSHRRAAAGTAAGIILLGACGAGPVEVEPPPPDRPAAMHCADLVDHLPKTVLDQSSREVSPDNAAAGAWGDPAIILRCGVPRPEALRANSRCLVVNKVGWFAEKAKRGYVFTTIGRGTFVELSVPEDYAPEPNALVDVASAVRTHVPEVKPCQ